MRIIKTREQAFDEKSTRQIANKGCNICPFCGEDNFFWDYIKEGIDNKGIMPGITKTESKGFFNIEIIHRDMYSCLSCGAE